MDPFQKLEIGKTGLKVTRLGLGGGPLGLIERATDRQAVATVRRALALGIGYVDTSPGYGNLRSELRLGSALASVPRDSYVISTKVGYPLRATGNIDLGRIPLRNLPEVTRYFDFSRDGVLRCFEQSLQRLRLDKVEILYLHVVPEEHYRQAIEEAYPTLAELRSQGVVKAIGAGMSDLKLIARFIREGDFDCFLIPYKYTLLDQSALSEVLPLCLEKDVSIVIGTPFTGGYLLGPDHVSPDSSPPPPGTEERVRRIWAVCDRYRVPVGAAALQFVCAHPAVASTIPGARSVREAKENIRLMQYPIPPEYWDDLRREGLISSEAPTPKTH